MEKLRMFVDQTYAPAPKFTEADVPDLAGKVMVVTGANTGIGKEIAHVLLVHNAKVYVACRSKEKAEKAMAELREATGKGESDVQFIELDLSSFASIRKAAEELKSKETKLDVLINNAGVMSPPIYQLTSEGYDMQFGTNTVGPALLTTLLLPLLRAASTPDAPARVVFTSSLGHMAASAKEPIAWDTLRPASGSKEDEKRKNIGPDGLYYQSKVGVILLAQEFAKRQGNAGIVFTSLHPGTIESELGRHWGPVRKRIMGVFIPLKPTAMGAINALYAGTSPEGKDLNGKYIIPWARVGEPRHDLQDEKLGERLWNWVQEQISAPRPDAPAGEKLNLDAELELAFSPDLIPPEVKDTLAGDHVRPLAASDYARAHLDVLRELTIVVDLGAAAWGAQFRSLLACPETYYPPVVVSRA